MLLRSLKLFTRGPVWGVAGAVSVLTTAIAIVEAIDGEAFWMWLFLAALALVVAAFWSFHRARVMGEGRDKELPSAMERLLQSGMDRLDRMVAAQKADPERLGPWNEQEEEAWEFFYEARKLLIDHDKRSLLDDLAVETTEARRREQEKQNRPFKKLTEREEAGEKVRNAEKMRVWAANMRRSSIGEMEAMLTGVSKVAKRLDKSLNLSS